MSKRKKKRPSSGNLPTIQTDMPSNASGGEQGARITTVETMVETAWSGPLPQPELLAAYEELVPGTGTRIIEYMEREQAHRHSFDNELLAATRDDRKSYWEEGRRGQLAAMIISLTSMALGALLGVFGGTAGVISGSALAGTSLVSIVTVFIKGRAARRADGHELTKLLQRGEPPRPEP